MYRDLELQFAVVTENPQLQDQLHKVTSFVLSHSNAHVLDCAEL